MPTATLEQRVIALANAIGPDIKSLTIAKGDLSTLNTTAKTNLVAAINELYSLIGSAGAAIDDNGTGASVAWSASKIQAVITASTTAVKDSLVNGASTALDTLQELAAALGNDANFATTLATNLAARVRFDAAQTLTAPQKTQALTNIGAASATDLATLTTAVGDTGADYAATYATAKS